MSTWPVWSSMRWRRRVSWTWTFTWTFLCLVRLFRQDVPDQNVSV